MYFQAKEQNHNNHNNQSNSSDLNNGSLTPGLYHQKTNSKYLNTRKSLIRSTMRQLISTIKVVIIFATTAIFVKWYIHIVHGISRAERQINHRHNLEHQREIHGAELRGMKIEAVLEAEEGIKNSVSDHEVEKSNNFVEVPKAEQINSLERSEHVNNIISDDEIIEHQKLQDEIRQNEIQNEISYSAQNEIPVAQSAQSESENENEIHLSAGESISFKSDNIQIGETKIIDDEGSIHIAGKGEKIGDHHVAGHLIDGIIVPQHKHSMKDQFVAKEKDMKLDVNSLSESEQIIYKTKVARVIKRALDWKLYEPRFKNLENEVAEYHFPKVILTGVKKCGTGALSHFLNTHPLIENAGEVYYWNRYHDNPLQWYKEQMPMTKPSQIAIEKTPSYFFVPSVIDRLKNFIATEPEAKDIKFINIICDPARRIFSDFLHMNRFNQSAATIENFSKQLEQGFEDIELKKLEMEDENLSWEQLLEKYDEQFAYAGGANFGKVLLRSAYSIYLKKWYSNFEKNQNFINLDGSEIYVDPGAVLIKVQNFLGLPIALDRDNFYFDRNRNLYCHIDFNGRTKCPGSSKGRSMGKEVPIELKDRMREFLAPFTAELEEIEGKSFSHWDW